MKNLLFLLSSLLFFSACIDKDPKLDEAKYMSMQQEYEANKNEIASVKTSFYNDNQETLSKRIAMFRKIKDSSNQFTGVSTDTTYFHQKDALRMTNFPMQLGRNFTIPRTSGSKAKIDAKTAIFIAKDGNAYAEGAFSAFYEELFDCEPNKISAACTDLKVAKLQDFLNLKYAFVVAGHTLTEPSLEGSSNFSPGIFVANIIAYDLSEDKPILNFSVVATNSDEVSYREGGFLSANPLDEIKGDFRVNIQKALWEGCKKHFNFGS